MKRVRGLGDVIENITEVTGIKKVVDKIAEVADVPCGCGDRKAKLNKLVPLDKK